MRKILLFAMAIGLSTFGFSQVNQNAISVVKKGENTKRMIEPGTVISAGPIQNKARSNKGTVSSIAISSSANVYSILTDQQSYLSSNEATGLIMFTARGNAAAGFGASSGDIVVAKSVDGGSTWSHMVVANGTSAALHRYPSGVVFNPSSKNSDPNNAYGVVAGPSTGGSGWVSNFFGSAKMDSTYITYANVPGSGSLIRNNMATAGQNIYICGSVYTSAPYALDTLYFMKGSYNATTHAFDWVNNKLDFDFVIDSEGDEAAYVWDFRHAWSADGSIGYLYVLGRDSSNDTRSYQPIVWKTTNGGTTWVKQPVFDFSTVTAITDELREMGGTTMKRPQFNGSIDGVVDMNGNLHLMSVIHSAFSNNNDSLGYYYTQTFENSVGYNTIFDVYMTSTGWDARKISRVYTIDMADDESTYGAVGWDIRLQAGRTADGSKVFAVWSETDTAFALTSSTGFYMNTVPDIIAQGFDVQTGNVTPVKNFTLGTAMEGDCFFHSFSSDVDYENETYTLHISETDLGATDSDPVFHNYLKGVTFTDSDFGISINDVENNIMTVSQNRPNPFNGNTSIDIKLSKSENVTVEVVNLAGQKIMANNHGKLPVGTTTINIDGSALSSGVYFYTVKAGNYSTTNKMIVR